jgi:CheY-like chemotaxis protein
VSRILVADDNSNIQKMVALALKDEGIDVVAVGNGEAAMRKIPDLRPDLVLADIFMPVRNGYEVCEFVKSDSRYMNTPVVLLVGAFDPLDEQETQRVRADGVLKKPFVPPDPLINMVKALLAKSNGQKPVGMPLPVPAPIQPATPVQAVTPVQAATPLKPVAPPQATQPPVQPASSGEIATPALPAPRLQTKASPPAQPPPVGFANQKPSQRPTSEAEDTDEVTTAVRDPNLGDPFWATPAEPEQTEKESETKPTDMIDMHSFGDDESPVEPMDEPPSHFHPEQVPLDMDDFAVDVEETTASPNAAPAQHQTYRPAREGDTAVAKSENDAPSSYALPETPEVFKFDPALTFPSVTQNASTEEGSTDAGSAFAEPTPLELLANDDAAKLSWPPVSGSAADAHAGAEKTSDAHAQIEPIELELPSLPDHEAVLTAATEAARLAFAELNTLPSSGASRANSDASASAREKHSLSPSKPANTPAAATPEVIEAVVNRLLERMQPQIMEVVNREVLRPAIEAIVRREMKKS